MHKKGFVLSWFYPPGNSSEGIITYKLLSHSGFEFDVWTRKNQNQNLWDRRVDEAALSSPNVNTFPVDNESEKRWIAAAVEYFTDHHGEYDFVMSRSMPAFSHEAAREIKRRFPEVVWIASFGDPLTDTPYLRIYNKGDNPYSLRRFLAEESASSLRALHLAASRTRRSRKLVWHKDHKATNQEFRTYAKINDFTIRESDLVILNNDYQFLHTFSEQYTQFKSKGLILPHTFDESMYPHTPKGQHKKIVFSYTGHLDEKRNAKPLLQALTKLKQQDKDLAKKVEFNFYGSLSKNDKLFILDHQLFDIVKLRGDVDYRTSLKIMHDSDWLLLFDANFTKYTDTNIYFAAKLADYIGSRSHILAITQLVGASADIVRKVGGGIVCSHSADEVAMYLAKIIYQSCKPAAINETERQKFSVEQVSKNLDKAINAILKRTRP